MYYLLGGATRLFIREIPSPTDGISPPLSAATLLGLDRTGGKIKIKIWKNLINCYFSKLFSFLPNSHLRSGAICLVEMFSSAMVTSLSSKRSAAVALLFGATNEPIHQSDAQWPRERGENKEKYCGIRDEKEPIKTQTQRHKREEARSPGEERGFRVQRKYGTDMHADYSLYLLDWILFIYSKCFIETPPARDSSSSA